MVCTAGQDCAGIASDHGTTQSVGRIAGGFVLLSVTALVTSWRACQARPLGIGDFRAWLACHELEARRCGLSEGRTAAYDVADLAKLLGVTRKRASSSVRRLVAAGLLEWSAQAIGFPDPFPGITRPIVGGETGSNPNVDPEDIKTSTGIGFPDHLIEVDKRADEAKTSPNLDVGKSDIKDSIGGGKGSVAIPRRMLRYLVAGARPALIATVLGLLLRCLSRRKDGWNGRGRVKASWIARTFGVSLRQVKAARLDLIDLGWIEAEPSDQWVENRWGRAFRIDLGWKAPASGRKGECITPFPGASSAPPPAVPGPSSTPPDLHQEPSLSGGANNQEPARGPFGFSIEDPGKEDPSPTVDPNSVPTGRKPVSAIPAPKLADVRIEDLKDTARLLDLYRQAVARGLVGTAEADRLKFIAAAEHALAIATNPAALFAWLFLNGCWRYATQAAEDRANARIKAHLRGPEPTPLVNSPRAYTLGRPVPTSGPPEVSVLLTPLASSRPIESGGLSEDARIVKAMREASIRAGIYRDPWPEVSAQYPDWDRARWDRALVELRLA